MIHSALQKNDAPKTDVGYANSLSVIRDLAEKANKNKSILVTTKKDIVRTPQFQIDGVYDETAFQAQVNSSGYTKESYIDLMANLLASELYRNSLSGINFATKNEIHEIASLLEH